MTGEHVIYDEAARFSLGAGDSTHADPQLEHDFAAVALTRRSRNLGATWTVIGRAEGKPPKIAKRDAKRLAARTRRAWYLHHNQDQDPGHV